MSQYHLQQRIISWHYGKTFPTAATLQFSDNIIKTFVPNWIGNILYASFLLTSFCVLICWLIENKKVNMIRNRNQLR